MILEMIVGQIHERIPGAEWVLFEESSHMPHVEEPEAFLAAEEAFLLTIDTQSTTRRTPTRVA